MGVLVAGSNPAEVVLGIDEDTGAVKYSNDGKNWNDTASTGGGASTEDILNAVGNYEAQLAAI